MGRVGGRREKEDTGPLSWWPRPGPQPAGQGRGRLRAGRRVPALRLRVISLGRGPGRRALAGPATRGLGAGWGWGTAWSSARAPAGSRAASYFDCLRNLTTASALPGQEKPDRTLTRAHLRDLPLTAGDVSGRLSPPHCARGRGRTAWGRRRRPGPPRRLSPTATP